MVANSLKAPATTGTAPSRNRLAAIPRSAADVTKPTPLAAHPVRAVAALGNAAKASPPLGAKGVPSQPVPAVPSNPGRCLPRVRRWKRPSDSVVEVDGDAIAGTKIRLLRCPRAIRRRLAAKTANARQRMTSRRKEPQRSSESIHGGRTECRCLRGRDSLNTNRKRRLIQ